MRNPSTGRVLFCNKKVLFVKRFFDFFGTRTGHSKSGDQVSTYLLGRL